MNKDEIFAATGSNGVIGTVSGRYFDFFHPTEESIRLVDMMHATVALPRWNAQTEPYYTVMAHEIAAALLVEILGGSDRAIATTLTHDCSEGYLSDLPRPIKQRWPEIRTAEHVVQETICRKYDLLWPFPEIVDIADYECLVNEALHLKIDPPDYAVNHHSVLTAEQHRRWVSMMRGYQVFPGDNDMLDTRMRTIVNCNYRALCRRFNIHD